MLRLKRALNEDDNQPRDLDQGQQVLHHGA